MQKQSKITFALDIGTRSIVGLLIEDTNEGLVVQEIISKEHLNRAMFDGQIHNIPQVSLLVKEIKEELETKSGRKLDKVAVAAAGRSLKTIKATAEIILNSQQLISKEDVLNLELQGAQQAQATLLTDKITTENSEFYCVGYSVSRYYLDDNEIGNLLSQRGHKAGLELVAAFLPKVVIDSLQTVLVKNELKLANITLEPIAAINAIIPPSMRKLNLALVDIGAGTSDIAISDQGSITAYGMVPIAGDEITEALSTQYILDFNDSENLKRKLYLNPDHPISFCDVLGIEHQQQAPEIIKSISPAIQELAEKISAEILNLNTKAPQAVVLIGGGSLTPYLTTYIAASLGLSPQRVAAQKASAVKEIISLPPEFQGPEIITPLGIALTAIKNFNFGFIPVQVNGNNVNLINLGNNTILNALLAAGIETGKGLGRPGRGLTIEVNGKTKAFPGTMGQRASITKNQVQAELNTLVYPKDKVEYLPAQDGQPGQGWVRDLVKPASWIKLNDQPQELPLEIIVNGIPQPLDTELQEGDKVYLREYNQVGELLEYWKLVEYQGITNFTLVLNGLKKEISHYPFEIIRDGRALTLFDQLEHGDEVSLQAKENKELMVSEVLSGHLKLVEKAYTMVSVNEEEVQLQNFTCEVKINGSPKELTALIQAKDLVEVDYQYTAQPILIDVFPQINFTATPPPGHTNLEILLNGQAADYTAPLEDGDKIQLNWR